MKSVELFVGAGGLGIGASLAGFEPVAVVDWDKWACDTLRENKANGLKPIADWPIIETDVRNFDFESLKTQVDLVTGGPPCQPFSMGGRHKANLDTRDMFPHAIRAVRELAPRAFVFENVKGLTRASFSNYLEYIHLQLSFPKIQAIEGESWMSHLSRLEDHRTSGSKSSLSYRVVKQVLNSADYGVPQRRERVFFVGFRSDTSVRWHFPNSTHSKEALLWSKWRSGNYWERHKIPQRAQPDDAAGKSRAEKLGEEPSSKSWATVRDAISDLPDPEQFPKAASKYHDHRFQPGARSYIGHTGSPYDEPAKTLKAGVHGVPGGENMLRRNDGSVRYFSVRECARLQTFPDNMVFHGSWSETMRQLGNAVPCELSRIVVSEVHKELSKNTR